MVTRCHKNNRRHKDYTTVTQLIRKWSSSIDDFSSFAKNIRRRRKGLNSVEYMETHKGDRKLIRRCKPSDSFSLVKSISSL